jgi:hypothetical protein
MRIINFADGVQGQSSDQTTEIVEAAVSNGAVSNGVLSNKAATNGATAQSGASTEPDRFESVAEDASAAHDRVAAGHAGPATSPRRLSSVGNSRPAPAAPTFSQPSEELPDSTAMSMQHGTVQHSIVKQEHVAVQPGPDPTDVRFVPVLMSELPVVPANAHAAGTSSLGIMHTPVLEQPALVQGQGLSDAAAPKPAGPPDPAAAAASDANLQQAQAIPSRGCQSSELAAAAGAELMRSAEGSPAQQPRKRLSFSQVRCLPHSITTVSLACTSWCR